MSDKLLSPQIQGPVSVLNSSVGVGGALAGAKVALLQNGVPLNLTETADQNGTALVMLGGLTLTAHAKLTATQTFGNATSDPGPEEPVMDVPAQVPPLAFLSLVHEWMDAVVVGGTIPSALIELYDQNQIAGLQGAGGTYASLPYQKSGPIKKGAPLLARQVITWQGQSMPGPLTPTLPVQPNPLQDRMMPPPSVAGPLSECDTVVPVTGIIDGATLSVEILPKVELFYFLGNSVVAGVQPLKQGEQVTASQSFSRMNLNSPPSSPPAPVLILPVPAPRIQSPVCADSPLITLSGLRPGCTVLLFAGRTSGNTTEQEGPWKATAQANVQSFPLPANLQGSMSGPAEFLFAFQEDCQARRSGLDNPPYVPLISLSQAPPQPVLGTMVECGRKVHVEQLEAGTTVAVTSDQLDWPSLASPAPVYGTTADIDLNRPLRAAEMVTVTVSPCGSGQGNAASGVVQPLQTLDPPVVHDPVRAWQTSVLVEKVVPGARVHVFVDNVWRGSADAATDTVRVPVGSLLGAAFVEAQQCLCLAISGRSPRVEITWGQMKFEQMPAIIFTNPAPQTVTMFARDLDDNHLVDAQILTWPAKQAVGKTNQPLTRLFPYFYNAQQDDYTVQAPGYLPNNLLHFGVADPPPQANFSYSPKQPYANQVVYFANFSTGPITGYEWDFGLSKMKSFAQHPTFKYVAGTFNATLTVKGPGGQSVKSEKIIVSLPPNNQQVLGFDEVELYFCPALINNPKPGAHSTLYIYVADLTVSNQYGQPKVLQQGYLGGGQNFAGVCGPGQGSGSETVKLTDKHQHHIVCVDPDLCGGQNDPTNGACIAWQGYFWGKQGAGSVIIVVS